MIGKLATRDSRTNKQFKPQIHQSRGRGQNRNYNYNQRNHQDRPNNRSNCRNREPDQTEVGLDMNKILGVVSLEEI